MLQMQAYNMFTVSFLWCHENSSFIRIVFYHISWSNMEGSNYDAAGRINRGQVKKKIST